MEGRREDLRRLAVWLARRRTVDEAVTQLTHYGPAASERVHTHLAALSELLRLESDAFAELASAAPEVPQLPLPTFGLTDVAETVISLTEERSRRQRT